jgi:hypothetical protein
VKYTSPDGPGMQEFFFSVNKEGEKWAKNLSNIRQFLPFSSIIDNGGVVCWSTKHHSEGYLIPNEIKWQSGQ